VTDAGSGAIITGAERTAIGTNTTNNTGPVTVHSDVTDAGSGAIITSAERSEVGVNTTHSALVAGNPHVVTATDVGLGSVDNVTVEIDTGTLQVKDLGIDTAQLAANSVNSSKIANDSIVDADINSAAAIAWSKVSKTSSAIDDIADVNASTPTNGQALTWDNGTSKWIPATIAAGAGGSDTEVQYNNGGSLDGDSTYTFNDTTKVLTVSEISATTYTGLPAATTSTEGVVEIGDWATKVLGSDKSNINAEITDLTFINLTVGQLYEFRYQHSAFNNTSDSVFIANVENGTQLLTTARVQQVIASGTSINTVEYSGIFEATTGNTTLTVTTSGASTNAYLRGNNTRGETYLQLREIKNTTITETTKWD